MLEYNLFQPNPVFKTDSYKLGGHFRMIPDTITNCRSYYESRRGALYPTTVFFGLQYILERSLCGPIIRQEHIDDAMELCQGHFGDPNAMNVAGWTSIVRDFGGYLPLEIRAVPEGSNVPVDNMLFDVRATVKGMGWLAQYYEGVLMKTWRPSTVATKTYYTTKLIEKFMRQTSDNPVFDRFAFHDFSYRSATCEEDARLACAAMLLSTMGTDTPAAMEFLRHYYGASYNNVGFSVPATEHRNAMAFGDGQGNEDYLRFQLQQYPNGILSLVGDTHSIVDFINIYVRRNRDLIIARHQNSSNPLTKLVIRPDSPRFVGDTPAAQCLWMIDLLGDIFGYTPNSKGYKTLHPAIGGIYGDGLKTDAEQNDIHDTYSLLAENKWDCSCLVVGQGGGALESKRDTQRTAIKPSFQERDGVWEDLIKTPLDQSKRSKAGDLKLIINDDGNYETINQHDPRHAKFENQLKVVYRNGHLLERQNFYDIRNRLGRIVS